MTHFVTKSSQLSEIFFSALPAGCVTRAMPVMNLPGSLGTLSVYRLIRTIYLQEAKKISDLSLENVPSFDQLGTAGRPLNCETGRQSGVNSRLRPDHTQVR